MKHIIYYAVILGIAIFAFMNSSKIKNEILHHSKFKSFKKNITLESKYINKYCNKYHVKPELVKAVIHVESNNDPYAESTKGACGLMQILPSTADSVLHQNISCSELKNDVKLNLEVGVKYIKTMLTKFPNISFALAAYNAGPGNADKYMKLGYIPYSSNPIDNVYGYSVSVISYINRSEGYNYATIYDNSSKFLMNHHV
jgi:soluble lytic murein transglycosylase-like protein